MSKLSICHASLLESYLSVKLAICQSYLFVMLATCHSYMSKQLAHLVPVLRKFLVKLPLITALLQPVAVDRPTSPTWQTGCSAAVARQLPGLQAEERVFQCYRLRPCQARLSCLDPLERMGHNNLSRASQDAKAAKMQTSREHSESRASPPKLARLAIEPC